MVPPSESEEKDGTGSKTTPGEKSRKKPRNGPTPQPGVTRLVAAPPPQVDFQDMTPEQPPPDQPEKTEPSFGAAIKVTVVVMG